VPEVLLVLAIVAVLVLVSLLVLSIYVRPRLEYPRTGLHLRKSRRRRGYEPPEDGDSALVPPTDWDRSVQ
jgi:hypothetical protein